MEEYELFKSKNTLLIAQNDHPITAFDRINVQQEEVTVSNSNEHTKGSIKFYFILGLYMYEIPDGDQKNKNLYFLVLVTDIERFDFFNVCKVKKFVIIPLSYKKKNQNSINFCKLLDKGLNQCSMYFCINDSYNLTLTFQQQFENQASRSIYTWNEKAIDRLKKLWPNAKFYKEVIGGHFVKEGPIVIISRKSNKYGGCHTWNRGADINGNSANFIENEEIFIKDEKFDTENDNQDQKKVSDRIADSKISAISHIEISGSCPFFWSQYPTMQLSRPFHFGPEEECEKRFDLHFNKLYKIYEGQCIDQKTEKDSNLNANSHSKLMLVIVSLLSDNGKEERLNSTYEELAKKRQIKYIKIDFNKLMKEKGKLTKEIKEKAGNYFDESIIENGIVKKEQTKILRVNCSSCLDRTSVFMEILFQQIYEDKKKEKEEKEKEAKGDNYSSYLDHIGVFMEILYKRIFNGYKSKEEEGEEKEEKDEYIGIHKKLWKLRSDEISREYAITRGMKTYLMDRDYQTHINEFIDYGIQIKRFFYSIFYEGQYTDAYNAVLQEHTFTKFEKTEFFQKIILFIYLIFLFIYLYIFEGRSIAVQTWKERIKTIINHPHIPDLRDADEFDNIDFADVKREEETEFLKNI